MDNLDLGNNPFTGEPGNPGLEVGISAPPVQVVDSEGAASDQAGSDSSAALTWDSLSDIYHPVIAEDVDEAPQKGSVPFDPTAASPAGGVGGTVLTLGTNPDGSHFFTGNRNIDAVLIGSKWSSTNLTYSFPTSGTNYNGTNVDANGVNNYHLDLGTQQQNAARAAFAQLSALTGLVFTEITETDTTHANIRISQTADADAPSAYGGFPSDFRGVAGDIWFGRTNQPYYDMAFRGSWGYATMMHEIGHTMGLKHGHQDYTNSDLSFYFGTFPQLGTQSLTSDRDGQSWSLMTYTPAPFTNSNFAGEKINQPQTYMQYDIAALQYLYGANFNTNSGDTTYTFSQTTGEMFINGVGQGAPSGNKIYLTIWDGGGNDTIDVSNYSNGVTVDLRPGEFSTFDVGQLANNLAYQSLTNLAPGNIAMSLLYNNDTRSLIENVKGGSGNDIFVGNTANNILDGGAGSDTVIFTSTTGVNVTLNDTNTDVIVSHDGETDTLRSIENIGGTAGADLINGNSQNNTLTGGSGGADTLYGLDGNDRLIGGGFSVVNNAIITKAGTTANTAVGTAINPQALNAYTLVSDANTTNSTTTPHATINATAAGGGLEYYRLDVAAGATGIFDIDGSSIDTWIELVDSTGTTILANNDDSITDAGSQTGNSYLTFTFSTAGTYYLRVGRWTQPSDTVAQALAAGTTYTLNISLSSATVNTSPLSASNTSSALLNGGEGDDYLQGTLGNDKIRGGNGIDTASFVTAFSNTTTGVTVDLNLQGAAQNTVAAGNDLLVSIENLIGSQYNDTLTGDGNDNVIEGGLGNDTLAGGGGIDTASYAGATAGVTVNLGLQGGSQNTVNAGSDTLSGFENLLGSNFNDTLTGDINANTLTGGLGNDTLSTGVNVAIGVVDVLDGGIGTDTASFAGFTNGVNAALNGASDGVATFAGNQIAILRGIENLIGGTGNDTLTGDTNDNAIEGGLGDDTLDGGAGTNDTVVFTGSTAVTINLATTTAQVTGWGNDTITNFENVRTGSGADNVTGDGNDNTFFDGGGNDTYNGAGGTDTVDYSGATSTTTVNLNTTTAQNTGTTSGNDTITNIENVTGSLTNANTLTGNTLANRLTGGNVSDTIIGGNGNDVIFGGAGADVLLGGSSGALDDGSSDTIEGGAGNDFIAGGQGNDTLRGGDGDDSLVGGIANTSGTTFTNDAGNDIYDGGDGTDTAVAYYTDHTGVISFDLRNLVGNSDITENGASIGSFTSIERVIARGGTNNDVMHGTGYLDTLVGNAGNDILDGWYGNDTLSGGLGDDTLDGGEGLDTATYVNATAGVNVDLRIQGVAQDTGGEGIDTLIGIEYLTGSGFGDTLRGNDDFNLIIDNAVTPTTGTQTDSLYGYGGNDTISVTRAAAAIATNVLMDGGDGDDLIQLIAGTVTFSTDSSGNPFDTLGLSSGVSYAAPGRAGTRNLDNVTVYAGTGNDRVVLTGVNSALVDLGTGNDVLSISTLGTAGQNSYDITTGTGQDVIQFAGSSATQATIIPRTSIVRDFTVGDTGDRLELRTASGGTYAATSWVNTTNFTGLTSNTQDLFATGYFRLIQSGTDMLFQVDRDGAGATNTFVTVMTLVGTYTGGFTAFNFDGAIGNLTLSGQGALNEKLTGATGDDVLNGNDGNDKLIGLAGNDTLNGGNGNDVLRGGLGNDTLDGGADNDTATYVDATVGVTVSLAVAGPQVTGDGTDTLISIENLTGSAFADTLTGDGNDNILDGQGGVDNLTGGLGNDTYYVDDTNDAITELLNEGTDIVYTSALNYTMAANLENLTMIGTAKKATGNGLDNVMIGNQEANNIRGGAGNDTINGKGGYDTLFGGIGNDTFVFEHGTGIDTVMDFVSGTDKLDLSAIGFVNFAAVQAATHDDAGGNAVIDLGNGESVTLMGVSSSQLQSGDVILTPPGPAAVAPAPTGEGGGDNPLDLSALGVSGLGTDATGPEHDAGALLDLGDVVAPAGADAGQTQWADILLSSGGSLGTNEGSHTGIDGWANADDLALTLGHVGPLNLHSYHYIV